MNLDFKKVRTFQGSQHNGFEELIAQLAHLEKITNQKTFIRKEGAGGDAGLECYWVLEDESEIGWQAKYFIDGMDSSKWGQIEESFKTALDKHPKLSKFIVSIPLDRTDSRKKGRKGKDVVSLQDEWDHHIEKWKGLANKKGRPVEFGFWGKHEILLRLSTDTPQYTGRALFWFNEPMFSTDEFETLALRTKEALGERYTPQFHIDLPVAKYLHSLGNDDEWWEMVSSKAISLSVKSKELKKGLLDTKQNHYENDLCEDLISKSHELVSSIKASVKSRNLKGESDSIYQSIDQIEGLEDHFIDYDNLSFKKQLKSLSESLRSFFQEFYHLREFVDSPLVKINKSKTLLIKGEAGIGKSHLLCDFSLQRIKNKAPTVFVLGSSYRGGNPIDFISDIMDLKGYQRRQILGALDAVGESNRSRALIVIDAINEGLHREEWNNEIRNLLSEINDYQYVGLLLSCRSTYLNHILPDSVSDSILPQILHEGFKGYENRAADKYLSMQGISKPSAPILAPEFTNPLFLKTCCKAIKDQGLTSFPKGFNGLTSLFDFYLTNIERVISKKKVYNPYEKIVSEALRTLADNLFPNDLFGIPTKKARQLINELDPNPNRDDTLFQLLLHEGVIAEEISYRDENKPIVRFTFERFSDHFIAEKISSSYSQDTISTIFSETEQLGIILRKSQPYEFSGIFEALAIQLADRFNVEILDLLPKLEYPILYENDHYFIESVIWRSKDSFTERTLDLLNNLVSNRFYRPEMDVLLKLSTEPDHPWNAEIIHRNLIKRKLSERDLFWSIYIAEHDSKEEDGNPESTIRTIIDWSCFGDLSNLEKERARLTSIILIWFFTTSNRIVRDQSTKSLVRLLVHYPDLVPELIEKFQEVDDLYVLERLYSSIYGVVTHLNNSKIVSLIATKIYDAEFKNNKPKPHFLLRDYARGIMEYAHYLGALNKDIKLDNFRPPYQSDWPLDNPSEKEIEKIIGDEKYGDIWSSVSGLGDFGRYTMNCIHEWSTTSLTEPEAKSGIYHKGEFAFLYLEGDLRIEYLKSIEKEIRNKYHHLDDERKKEKERLFDRINEELDDEGKEHLRWVSGLYNDRSAVFSRKWAQRWVCRKTYELGWSNELFEDFERNCRRGRGGGHFQHMERIGKKYQWIALYEFLAHLSDNLHFIGRISTTSSKPYCNGPWEIHDRDHDPTMWIRKNGEDSYFNKKNVWWQRFNFSFKGIETLNDQITSLWSRDNIPEFRNLLTVTKPSSKNDYFVLYGFWDQHQERDEDKKRTEPELSGWFRINSLVVAREDKEKVLQSVRDKYLGDPHIVTCPTNGHQSFFGEYPWHPSYIELDGWIEPQDHREDITVKYLAPLTEYSWEKTDRDHSLEETVNFYMPAKELIDDLGLSPSLNDIGSWVQKDGKEIFLDPSINEQGASFALINQRVFTQWLNENNFEIIWLIGGEKMLFESHGMKHYGRLNYSGAYHLEDDNICGDIWFEEEK